MSPVVEELLVSGLDDWIQTWEVAWIAEKVGGVTTEHAIMEMSLAAISTVLAEGLADIGDIGDIGDGRMGVVSWNLPVEQAAERLRREWITLGTTPNIGDISGWLKLTPKGKRVAKEIEARSGREQP